MFMSAVPAYGRDYKNQREVVQAWNEGKDFLIQGMFKSGYINKDDAPKGATINIRYAKQRKVFPIKVT